MRTTVKLLSADILVVILCLVLFNNACKKKDDLPSSINLKFSFSHNVDGANLKLDTILYLNQAGNKYSVMALKYFIDNITLHKGADSVVINDTHYVDITDTGTFIYSPSVAIANGSYDGISFIFGLDPKKNVPNYFVNPPESNMFWPIQYGGGYHYMQLEGYFDSAGTVKNYAAMSGALYGVQYYVRVNLPQSSFTANGKSLTVSMAMNINAWFKPDTYNFNSYGDTAMTMIPAQQILHKNGANVFSVLSIQ